MPWRGGTAGRWDHPRMRGEHKMARRWWTRAVGSSPHARGTLPVFGQRIPFAGIIPACAGNTTTPPYTDSDQRDHPRMRGEHSLPYSFVASPWGSSPHARGTHFRISMERGAHGIIPACAGNTGSFHGLTPAVKDHPRMRGEHVGEVVKDGDVPGSSPHARGTLVVADRGSSVWGIIPACAGNTGRPATARGKCRDHPRMRGEHFSCVVGKSENTGSSPHARGTPCTQAARPNATGIIPACAGNTHPIRSLLIVGGDHPRMRGEHSPVGMVVEP